jgi:hypothetical protein
MRRVRGRFVIERRGRLPAVLVRVEDLERLEAQLVGRLSAVAGSARPRRSVG